MKSTRLRSMVCSSLLILVVTVTASPVTFAQSSQKETTPAVGDTTKAAQPAPARRGTSQGVLTAHLPYKPGMAPTFWSVATAETIMERYPDYRQAYWKDWTYVQGYMFHGIEILYRATGDRRYLEYIKRYVDSFIDDKGNFFGDKLTNLDNLMTGI